MFGSVHKLKKASKMKITCNGINVQAKSSIKYLRVILDQNMRGDSVRGNTVKKVNSVLTFLGHLFLISWFRKFFGRIFLRSVGWLKEKRTSPVYTVGRYM